VPPERGDGGVRWIGSEYERLRSSRRRGDEPFHRLIDVFANLFLSLFVFGR
jgi:hypothetical protein